MTLVLRQVDLYRAPIASRTVSHTGYYPLRFKHQFSINDLFPSGCGSLGSMHSSTE